MSNITFRPVRGKESSILNLPKSDGSVYFATDTGKILIDVDDKRLSMGGSGAAIVYGNAPEDLTEDETTQLYHIPQTSLEPKQNAPKVGDIIINKDGKFFRVQEITSSYFLCSLLAVSGSGDGPSSGGKTRPTLLLEELETYNLINGQDARVYLTATAAQVNGVSLAKDVNIKWSLTAEGETRPYHSEQKTVTSGERNFIDFGKYLRDSTITTMSLQATALNHEADSWIQTITLSTSSLELSHVSSFSPTNVYNPNNVVLSCNASGNTEKILDFWFDGELLEHRILKATDIETQSYTVPAAKCSHGYHTVHIRLYQSLDGNYGLESTPSLKFEIPVVISGDTTQKPIIWLGEYKDVYYNYDSIQIPFLVYDPQDTTQAVVHLYKNRIELESSPLTINKMNTFTYWEIADAELNQQNFYQLSCGEDENRKVEREISFKVEQDPNRSMTLVKQDNLKLNFEPTGRSNSESIVKRASWKQNGIEAKFENFNWYNNGWKSDEATKQTKLIISNGAKLTIPFGRLVFADTDASKQSNSIELQFRMRNIQNYQNLITNITRYQIKTGEDTYETDDELYNGFTAQTRYDNYDAYLQATLDADAYEKLEYWKVQKNINLNNVAIGLYDSLGNNSVRGFCVGTQDAFFSNGTNTVNVNFVEEDLINLSFVYSHSLKMLFIYINGCITGVIKSDLTTTFPIESGNIIFDSSNCDIDLFKFRIYNTDLNVNDIVVNYAVDRKDIETYDQNSLASENLTLKEYQLQFEGDKGVDSYNKAHPNDPLMPYIIYDTTDFEDNRLPWSKDITRNIKVEFINTPLDRAYANGELETLAKEDGLVSKNETNYDVIQEAVKTYYKHHCPSWTSTLSADDRVEIVVQGTSSEFYPRRNFKIKTKIKDVTIWDEDEKVKDEQGNETGEKGAFIEDDVLNIYMHKGPFEEIYNNDAIKVVEDQKYYGHEDCRLADGWYMNNYTNPTDRWTMKVDYMESSGSYNAGFASLIGNAYTKHPLQDYLGVISGQDNLKSTIAAFSRDIRWEEDYRTSLLGFPVMAFQKRLNTTTGKPEYLFVGYYRMLLDKGSDQVLGFKPSKKVVSTLFKDAEGKAKPMRDVAECWEFATNSRTFCSFKDPWNRVKFSFKSPIGESNEFTADKAPMVMNHFEYRYHWAEDYLDNLFKYKTLDQETLNELVADVRKDTGKTAAEIPDLVTYSNNDDNARAAQELTLSFYKNWEDVCSWVWSTNLESVPAQGTYSEEPVKLGKEIYNPQAEYYILTTNEAGETIYARDTSGAFNPDVLVYYIKEVNDGKTSYVNGHICGSEENLYKKDTFYKKVSGTYSLVTDAAFDPNIEYYTFTSYSDLVLSGYDENWNKVADGLADLLVKPATGTFDSSKIYFTYDGTKKINKTKETGAVQKVAAPNETDFTAGLYYELAPVTYSGIEYKYDTQEYRSAKFINELTQHFDPEYLATYFVATEVFELYDSRGKNCMMASWGPQKSGGNYIWYPIFYDIDTQLGINNTGIPSFEFNVDASDAGNYSTSDSILWNNFYKFFKSSYILTKYQNMRGTKSSWADLKNPPLQSVDYIEKWYTFDPKTHNSIACRGKRPLIATNLDMYFKYITITNDKAVDQGVGYLLGQDGVPSIDKQGAYFYALQGDRSQSRRQFLTNRLEYIDSWLNQGNYARAGNNRIRGRISANNISGGSIKDVHSDKWIETDEESYWIDREFGEKRHEFDSQYWLDLKPIRSSYVTAGDDSANYPSQKYDGLNTTKFKLAELEQGIRRGANYPEQLLYIYGMNQMQDVGDMSKLYWTEFFIEGNANKLTRLKLGHDGISTTDPNVNGGRWYNNKLNGITLTDLPLLKEANFSHIGLSNETTLNFEKSEKLENFRAAGTSKLTSVQFAEGVALNTLYLPESVTNLTLTQANLLTDLITDANDAIPRVENDELIAKPGLYIEGFFGDNFTSSINTINLDGGALGHNSYTLLERFYRSKLNDTGTIISMTDVKWCPYVKLSEGDEIDFNYAYYRDEGHYLLEYYPINPDNYNAKTFNALVLSGELYRVGPYTEVKSDDEFSDRRVYFKKVKQNHYELIEVTAANYSSIVANGNLYYIAKSPIILGDSAYDMLEDLHSNPKFRGVGDGSRPKITGTILIENSTAKEESVIRSTLQAHYPDVTFFFTNVTKAYSAKFVIYDEKTESYTYVKMKDGTAVPSIQKIAASAVTRDDNGTITTRFASPFNLYNPIKTHYDFQGWSTVPNPGAGDVILTPPKTGEADPWLTNDMSLIREGTEDYVYYAIFTIHEYELNFYNHDGSEVLLQTRVPYGNKAIMPNIIPHRDDSELSLYQSYDFQGYSLIPNGSIIDVSSITVSSDEEFYATFKLVEDIRNTIHLDWFRFSPYEYSESYFLPESNFKVSGYLIEPVIALQGKIVIPRTYEGQPVIAMDGFGKTADMPHAISHVFMEKDDAKEKPVYTILGTAFQNTPIKYFEFENTNIRYIDQGAFQNCVLDVSTLTLHHCPLKGAGYMAFLGGIVSTTKDTLILPSSMVVADSGAFRNLGCVKGTSLVIGSESNPSLLDLSRGGGDRPFTQNDDNAFGTIIFYSAVHDDGDLIDGNSIQSYFGTNMESFAVH